MESVQTVAGSHARTGSAASRPHSEMSEGGSPHVMQEGQEAKHREFRVKGRLQEDEQKLNLRLRITQPGGTSVDSAIVPPSEQCVYERRHNCPAMKGSHVA